VSDRIVQVVPVLKDNSPWFWPVKTVIIKTVIAKVEKVIFEL
jgi:hypothetical protein